MRKAEFEVPSEVMAEFAEEMASRDLDNKVIGTNEDNEIVVEVKYERGESKSVDELEKILDNLREQIEEEEEEEDEDQ
jgi:capsular polysaccharide biosynthesis protein